MSRKTAPILAIPAALLAILTVSGAADAATIFTPGNLVVSVEGNGVVGASSGPFTDNQAAPLTLFQYQTGGTSSVTYLSSFVLPQTAAGGNFAISGEYGSSSEGTLQLSSNGRYLTIMGYGVTPPLSTQTRAPSAPIRPTPRSASREANSARAIPPCREWWH